MKKSLQGEPRGGICELEPDIFLSIRFGCLRFHWIQFQLGKSPGKLAFLLGEPRLSQDLGLLRLKLGWEQVLRFPLQHTLAPIFNVRRVHILLPFTLRLQTCSTLWRKLLRLLLLILKRNTCSI